MSKGTDPYLAKKRQEDRDNGILIRVVDDQNCPCCNAGWPNRPKVGDSNGDWWWKCYNKECKVGYYLPGTDQIELEPTPEETASLVAKAKAMVDSTDFSKIDIRSKIRR